MAGWRRHDGHALSLPLDNVDTDQLIPARFMSVPRAQGYAPYLLHDLRRDAAGVPLADFPLNAHTAATALIAGRNFGSGSSREAAVYALVDGGIKAVIASSFGDIFSSNAVNNGLLPVQLAPQECAAFAQAAQTPQAITIDLERCEIVMGDLHAKFALDESWRMKLINGWDDIDLTRAETARIAAYKNQRHQTAAWAWPAAAD